jgi:hypothetical protein
MTLEGRILKIKYHGGKFVVYVNGVKKVLNSMEEMDNYLIKLLRLGKDPEKLNLLRRDLAHVFQNQPCQK